MSVESRLCKEILKEDFGGYTATIGSLLLLKGRLTLADLIKFSSYKPKLVRECLVVLIQHGIVYFTEPIDIPQKGATYYEIDSKKVLLRLRMGRIMRLTQEHYGRAGSAICRLLFLKGRLRIDQVLEWAKSSDTNQKDESAYLRAFTLMAQEQFITAVFPQHSRSMADRYFEAEEKELENYTILSAREAENVKLKAREATDAASFSEEYAGMKRKASDELSSQAKRRAKEDVYTFETEEEELEAHGRKKSKPLLYDIDPKVFFALNYDKYNMHFRNQIIADFATTRINRTAGIVMKTFFRSGKEKMKDIKEEFSPATTSGHIANMLEPQVFLRGDIVLTSSVSKEKPSVQEVVDGYFQLLRIDTSGFLALRDELGSRQYSVNFKKLRQVLKRHLLEALVMERFGLASCRILRILLDKGKLDELRIQKMSMLPLKDVRLKLDAMLIDGIVRIQEIPRSADRTPSHSFHLWFVDLNECFDELLVDVYRATTNLQQRKEEELLRRSRLIQKLSRQDVIANMELLNEIDKAEVAKMDKMVERIETSKDRLDAMVLILRDI